MMKKILNWMFAAILVCGASFAGSSCSDDDTVVLTSAMLSSDGSITL